MDKSTLPVRKLTEIWLAASDRAATPDDVARLNEAIIADGQSRQWLIDVVQQQSWLKWNGGVGRSRAGEAKLEVAGLNGPVSGAGLQPAEQKTSPQPRRLVWAEKSVARTGAMLLSAFTIGACLAGLAAWGLVWRASTEPVEHVAASKGAQVRFVSSTQCLWDPCSTTARPVLGQHLNGGESLHLLEGIAELSVVSNSLEARLQIEGPIAVMISQQGLPILRYGRMTLRIDGFSHETYPVETPFGRVLVEGGSEVGISSMGSTADVHAFEGGAVVESPWLVTQDQLQGTAVLHSGEALRIENVGGGAVEVFRAASDRDQFLPEVSMDSDHLLVGPDYISEIRSAQPVAYWRFEQVENGLIRNEMQDRFHGHLQRTVEWSGPRGNQAIQLGMSEDPGSMVVNDAWDPILAGDFSIEAWIKPSHFHLGSVIGFVGEFDWELRKNSHGILLEVCGIPHHVRPKCIRFLHRSPPTSGSNGVNCYSETNYTPRRWQHVVAHREGHQLRLFINGNLAQEAIDESTTPSGLKLVMGQLYSETVERFFTGQVDEVAIYDRALPEKEVRRHYEILRPDTSAAALRLGV